MEALSRLLPPMPPVALFGTLVLLSALKHVLSAAVRHGKPRAAVRVGAVSNIIIYPVKSGGGLPLTAARVTRCGLVDPESGAADRHFMLVNETGNFISQRQEPRLSMVTPSIHGDQLDLDAPEMETLSVPIRYQVNEATDVIACRLWGNEVVAADCGPEASSWFSEYLEKPARLMWTGPGVQKTQLYENYSHLCRPYDKTQIYSLRHSFAYGGPSPAVLGTDSSEVVAFQDWGQVLTISDASLSDLNTRLQTPVSMAHFRPNFTVSGTLPHAEDTWHKIYIADAQFTNLKLCGRCTMTTVDPACGVKSHDGQPLATLKCYRMKPAFSDPCFGVNVFCDVEGTINVGDMVEVTSQEE